MPLSREVGNLQSKQETVPDWPAALKIAGDNRRHVISILTGTDTKLNIALCPAGASPAGYWMLDMPVTQNRQTDTSHTGDIYVSNPGEPGNEQVYLISDAPIVTTIV